MEYQYIVNPETGRRVNLFGKIGQRVIRNYISNMNGGMIRDGSRIPPEQYQTGGMIRSRSRIPPEQYQTGGMIRSRSRIPPQQYQVGGQNPCNKGYSEDIEGNCTPYNEITYLDLGDFEDEEK
jgi:hypothetical protein